MLRIIAIVVLLVALIPKHAIAHLGDTVSQVNAQYGQPLYEYVGQQRGEEIAKHKWKAYFVYVTYFRGKSEDETYIHQATGSSFPVAEVRLLLGIASRGMLWHKSQTVPMWL